MIIPNEHRQAAVELLLAAASGRTVNQNLLCRRLVGQELGHAMQAAGLLAWDPQDSDAWVMTPRAHAFVNRVVAEAQSLLSCYCSPG